MCESFVVRDATVCVRVCVRACVCACVRVCVHVCVCLYTWVWVWIYACMHALFCDVSGLARYGVRCICNCYNHANMYISSNDIFVYIY